MTLSFTILLLTRHRLIRADFQGRGQPRLAGLYEQPRPQADDPATLVDAALRLHGRRARRVWVLSSEFWTNVIAVPAKALTGLAGADLEQFLGYESEAFTGVSPVETSLAYVPLAGGGAERRFWLTQVPHVARAGIEDAVRMLGGRVLGLAHPAGLPAAEGTERVEFWDEAIVCVRGAASPGGAMRNPPACAGDVVTIPRSTSAGRLAERIAAFRRESPAGVQRELWDGTEDGAARLLAGETPLRVGDGSTLRGWLESWAAVLADARPAVPLLRPAPQPLSPTARGAIAAGLAALTALGCYAHYQWQRGLLADLAREQARAQQPQQTLDDLKKEATPLEKHRLELEKVTLAIEQDLTHVRAQVQLNRARVSRLLESLAAHHHEELVVQQIAGQGSEVRVSGLCLQVGRANELASRLQRDVAEFGWQVLPAEVTDEPARAPGGPWKFTIVLREPATAAMSASTAPTN